jgi:hypothetical protein
LEDAALSFIHCLAMVSSNSKNPNLKWAKLKKNHNPASPFRMDCCEIPGKNKKMNIETSINALGCSFIGVFHQKTGLQVSST